MKPFSFDPTRPSDLSAVHRSLGGKRGRKRRSVEEAIPLKRIDGPFIRIADGSTAVVLTYPGANLSLATPEEQQEYAISNGEVLSAITADVAAIHILPDQVKSDANLIECDKAIERMSAALFSGELSGAAAEAERRCLNVLERHIRPEFVQAAVSTDNVEWHCYLELKYFHAQDVDIIHAAEGLARMIEQKVGKRSHVLGDAELLDFIELSINGHSTPERFVSGKVVMPRMR